MKITNEAKVMIQEVFDNNDSNCISAVLQKTCCGNSLAFNLSKLKDGDKPHSINDIPVLMGDDVEDRAKTVTIAVENGELAIQDIAESGCC